MSRLLLLKEVGEQDGDLVGGKGLAIAIMVRRGIRVPKAPIISCPERRDLARSYVIFKLQLHGVGMEVVLFL